MKIHLSSATIQSYENKNKSMDLFYNPIVIFENTKPFLIEQLKNINWSIQSDKIGSHDFDIQIVQKPSLEDTEDRNFIEFRLSKKDIPFIYDNYSCKITFKAIIELLDKTNMQIKHEALGIVKTKWSKGLL
ncbi:hypothetical protein [Arcobacter sp. LA11]|uniref:hypothetical protein n=1 Tax=Arcobacter sp. LA11 TaxID=1898176 RepID=UPI00093376C9|nr:hypothetical protein [Arcobacter sp. LA11]